MSNYTEADVAQDEAALLEFIESGEHGRGAAIAMVSRLVTAALKVTQMGPMREALEWIERETHPEDGLTFERIHAKAAGALSAPPAETKSTSGDAPVLYVLEVHVGDGEWEPAFLGTLASTLRERVDVQDRSMGPTRVAEYVRRPPAETTLLFCPKCEQRHPGPTNPCVLCEAQAAYSAERSAKDDAEMAAEAETTPAPERVEDGP